MTGYLLDTNLLSELLKKNPSATVLEQIRGVDSRALYTSVICVMELRHGARRHPQGERLWQRISAHLLTRVRLLGLGVDEALRAGDILADLATGGEFIGIEDILIGATALSRDLTVVTRNLRHFGRIRGLSVVSWWPE